MHDEQTEAPQFPTIEELPKSQRRVLGVLVEKAFTTPEYYPLTLKAVTTGCNQKSNRQPVTNYSEDDVYDSLDALRELGLVAVVHTESGRTERFRHYMRRSFDLSEPQLAILIELLLRGKQQLGELRSRASRMVTIESLEDLRNELNGLQAMNLLQSSGSLTRRGAEVDHNLYLAKEGQTLATSASDDGGSDAHLQSAEPSEAAPAQIAPTVVSTVSSSDSGQVSALESKIENLQADNRELHSQMEEMKASFQQLSDRFDDLRRDLGG